MVPPLAFNGATLHHHGGFRFALFPRRGGRVPELGDARTLEWIGRFLGRLHALGRVEDYAQRPALDVSSFGREPAEYLLQHAALPPELREVFRGVQEQALAGVERAYQRAAAARRLPCCYGMPTYNSSEDFLC